MPNRPSIPTAIAREILIESGHRCAVCGVGCPLERAHIIPWHESKEHKAEDLVCLCANCHQRADLEKWGEKTLREYKRNPWIMRQYGNMESAIPKPMGIVELTIAMELEDFGEKDQRLFQYALAAFLEISPYAIRITSIEQGSVIITIELPTQDAERLSSAYKSKDSELRRYLVPLVLLDLRRKKTKREGILQRMLAPFGRILAGSRKAAVPESTRQRELLIQQLENYGCVVLANNLRQNRGIGRSFEPAGSLNGFHVANPHRRVLSTLITSGLEGAGVEQVKRAVDISFKSSGLTIRQSERDILARMLDKGELRKPKLAKGELRKPKIAFHPKDHPPTEIRGEDEPNVQT